MRNKAVCPKCAEELDFLFYYFESNSLARLLMSTVILRHNKLRMDTHTHTRYLQVTRFFPISEMLPRLNAHEYYSHRNTNI